MGTGSGEFSWGKKFLRESLGKDNWNAGHLETTRKPGSVELLGTYEIDFMENSSNGG